MKVLLGVTGGIAAYKALELTRLYIKAGFEVQVVMTSGAKEFIQPLSFQALSGNPVRDSLFDANQEAGMGHIELARWADIIVIAPASAETLARLCHGRADDLLSTLVLASDRPLLVAPAMNRLMWANAATQENIELLKARGLQIMAPGSGEQACGEVGEGRLPEPQQIFNASQEVLAKVSANATRQQKLNNYWQGRKLLITAGPTHEAIDPVRFIGNRSSGKMGFAIAEAAAKAGAQVTLIAGPVSLKSSPDIERVDVRSAEQMFAAVKEHYQQQDCFIGAAAVADYRVKEAANEKIKKQDGVDELTLELVKNPDIIQWVAAQKDKPFVVGFAAETNNLIGYAKDKLARKNLDMICANLVGESLGFEAQDNQLTFITNNKVEENPLSDKQDQALALLAFIAGNN
ncbi:bifunctional phosphopantothenoylcysteine decarboxylase/phosphopantothenate--cysteine ligase CoaBC [Thiomicrorhabdus sediminis]|uniref:Coenzyme A biosynthesis bifunctional protein CoaBC n=1 Tax=Thiomicrorhabdus sediminis TaxID=2580412 RepID=A0A4P9K995_9GAMM|nr:bifunctional phosphopantothenoylcysteine decarboxylase/phosphopantothenate--cysteine ligase CoaBC [Thiomicrorhabdus sediminis]QCU90897.1 bifunctional phosphopantothenoylcysteine decarboxylase/phosphopantothenate--cysteine ligase CoaBC [Thiomicrorhabdus sediminis]